ncbi:MAG: hypothetical protein HOG49_14835, partial [Candidatus Scalindua sp.]|nr:hypothetical protein [Candidatus Scalindua sp.]
MPLKTNNNTSLTVEMTKRKFADKNIASVTSLTFQNKKNKERMAGSKQTDIALFMRVTTNNDQIVIEIEMEDDVSIGSILSFLFLNGTEKQSLLFNEKG